MNKSKKQVIPKLRFIDFTDDKKWDITTFGKLSIPVEERAGEDSYTLMSITSGVGLIPQTEKFGREIAGNSYKNYYVIQKGDFAYNKSATKIYPEGYIAMLQGYNNAALPNSIFTCFRIVDKESYPQFFNHLFSSNYHGKWLRKYITVGARANGALSVDNKYLWKMPVAVPKLKEQQKIADCLSSLDDLISDENEKLIALKGHKKGLMQKLFPADGETVPEWRFPEFRNCGEWQEIVFGEFANVLMCKRIFSNETNENGEVPFYKIGTLGGKPDAFISKTLFEEYKNKYSYPKKGEVLLTCSGTVGKCFQYDGQEAYYQDSNIVWIDNPTIKISNELLLVLLSNVDWSKLNSTTITRIYGSDLRNLTLKFPHIKKEQQKIANCLSELEALIFAQTKKIETLQIHRKALIQGLFPSSQEVFE
jgi:type I restriction enzyme S subunit